MIECVKSTTLLSMPPVPLFEEIFGRSRGDAYTFSYIISPVPIMIAFWIQ